MSTNKTANLKMHEWVLEDRVLLSEFNDNFFILDQEIQAIRDKNLRQVILDYSEETESDMLMIDLPELRNGGDYHHLEVFLQVQSDMSNDMQVGINAESGSAAYKNTETNTNQAYMVKFKPNVSGGVQYGVVKLTIPIGGGTSTYVSGEQFGVMQSAYSPTIPNGNVFFISCKGTGSNQKVLAGTRCVAYAVRNY